MSKINNKFMQSHLHAGKTFSNFFCKPCDQKKYTSNIETQVKSTEALYSC